MGTHSTEQHQFVFSANDTCKCGDRENAPSHFPKPSATPLEILETMVATFKERGQIYGDNYKRVGGVMMALFPRGVVLRTPEDFLRWQIFEMLVVKLTRLAVTGLTHRDSAHDIGVYGAMLESVIGEIPIAEGE